MDAWTLIKGQPDGTGKGLTTYPANTEPEKQAEHAACLELEKEGKAYRYNDNDGVNHPSGVPFIIWMPVADAA